MSTSEDDIKDSRTLLSRLGLIINEEIRVNQYKTIIDRVFNNVVEYVINGISLVKREVSLDYLSEDFVRLSIDYSGVYKKPFSIRNVISIYKEERKELVKYRRGIKLFLFFGPRLFKKMVFKTTTLYKIVGSSCIGINNNEINDVSFIKPCFITEEEFYCLVNEIKSRQ